MAENLNSKELCLVVLGEYDSSKTSVISCLLKRADTHPRPRTINCSRHEGEVRGRKLIVVDTPGWWKGYPLEDTSQRTKDELVLSVRKCPPGPHAFILAIASLIERNLRSVIEHLSLFGDDIWRHTIVVFTRRDSLEGTTIEQHIENEGKALKWLVEKCGKRYCVFDKNRGDKKTGEDQVNQLLERIEALKDSNRGRHFQMNEETLREVDERKRDAQQKASERQLQVQEKRKHLRKQKAGVINSLSEVRIVMLGWVMSGKTSAKNTILNKDKDAPLNKTEQCEADTASVDGRRVIVVDTPSWWKFFPAQYTPQLVKLELKQSLSLGSKSPHAVLIVVPAGVSFLEEQRKITEDNMKMFGDHVWKHTMVLFTRGSSLGNMSIEEHIETEGEPLRWLVEKCGNRYHVLDNMKRGDGSQVRELLEKIDELEASFDIRDLTQEAPKTEITPSFDKEDEKKTEMVEFLEKEWNRRDRKLEERVRRLWQETFGSAGRGDGSLDRMWPDFCENEESSDYGKRIRVDLPQTKSFDPNHTFSSEHFPPQSNFNEKMAEMFEREWGRCKSINADRIRGMLSRGRAENEPHKYGSKEWEELARHEAVVMERVQTIISYLCSKSDFACEPDEEERQRAREKVLMWKTQTSGLGSE
ncbi:GTPase IMAP family member 8-like isoform X2 [Engraulis encrasicolus]|uniref:GTPase IMAP family member 8-like isoform X2 n=1 Tax=Engraulis encrasicolus TaxID=184585 RepID=UPI002FD1AF6F